MSQIKLSQLMCSQKEIMQITEETKLKERIKKRQQRENILKAVRDREEFLRIDNREFIYCNQRDAGDECIQAYNDGAIAVCLIAQPGTGKTGTAQEVMIKMTTNPDYEKIIYTEDVITCTGMADNDWGTQFKANLLPDFRENVFHRPNLIKKENKKKLTSLKNGLIITDECHIASGSKMTIAKTLKECGILDVNVLELKNIKYLDVSATPDAVLNDYKKWGDKCRVIKIKPGPSYKGFEIMLKEGRIRDSPILENIHDYCEFLKILDDRYKNTTKKYFPFRILDPEKIHIFETLCKDYDWVCKNHNSSERIDEIDDLMKSPPIKHTIIFIKGFWRASKRMLMNHVGATYEQIPKNRNTSGTAQDLAARGCGNFEYSGDQTDVNLRPLHYCDKGAIEQYVEWFNKDCDFNTSKYSSNRIKSNGAGGIRAKSTKVSSTIVGGIDNDEEREPIIKICKTQLEAKQYYIENLKDKLGGRGPQQRKPNDDGYYEAIIRGGNKKIYNYGEIFSERKFGLNTTNFRLYPCYEDKNDKSTLQWCLIHY
jgi:hypothetical protein